MPCGSSVCGLAFPVPSLRLLWSSGPGISSRAQSSVQHPSFVPESLHISTLDSRNSGCMQQSRSSPLLLHISLVLFFAGLVAFLHPINTVLTVMAAALLGTISITYMCLTVLPMFSSDSPYRTPLSNVIWGFFYRFCAPLCLGGCRCQDEETAILGEFVPRRGIPTMTETMMHDAVEKSQKRDDRDGRAMVWTIRSLTDANELDPFVEALPDLIWSPGGRRRVYDNMINLLLQTRDIQLVSRIEGLLCGPGSDLPPHHFDRHACCAKALWAIACFSITTQKSFQTFDHKILASQMKTAMPGLKSCLTSAHALVRCSDFCSLSRVVHDAVQALKNLGNTSSTPDFRTLLKTVERRAKDLAFTEFSVVITHLFSLDPSDASMVQQSCDALKSCNDIAYDILIDYLLSSVTQRDVPYEFEATCALIHGSGPAPSILAQIKLRNTFVRIIDDHHPTIFSHPTIHPLDMAIDTILYLLEENPECLDADFMRALVLYVGNRNRTKQIIRRMFRSCSPKVIGSLLTKSLAHCHQSLTEKILWAIWVSSCHTTVAETIAIFGEEALNAVSTGRQYFLSACTVAVLKSHIYFSTTGPEQFKQCPSTTVLRCDGGLFGIMVEFMECRGAFPVPDNFAGVEAATFGLLMADSRPREDVSHSLQARFADSFWSIVSNESRDSHMDLIKEIIKWMISWPAGSPATQIFDNPNARETIRKTLTIFVDTQSNKQFEPKDFIPTVDRLITELASHAPPAETGAPAFAGSIDHNVPM
ncbi:hypothetical protein MVEN_00628600 [Mycena venus]|uniref:Uncharacterized protein n=1 Tax=Mycena venus TaxID=2733690 RepID=A0A8H6YPG9_9AGAR|nr:hypothetical protein MVEN_00628600 [Mycena venus]